MTRTTITFVRDSDKKHSIRYNGVTDAGKPISFYIPLSLLGDIPPTRINVTIEEAN